MIGKDERWKGYLGLFLAYVICVAAFKTVIWLGVPLGLFSGWLAADSLERMYKLGRQDALAEEWQRRIQEQERALVKERERPDNVFAFLRGSQFYSKDKQ